MVLEDRFRNYIEKFFPESNSEDFLTQNLSILQKFQADLDTQREFRYYKALSNELRFHIYKLLQSLPLCTCALARLFGKNENLINHHLKILENEGLIEGEQKGYFTIYRPIYRK
jgi:ArsR family transcriptional regulator